MKSIRNVLSATVLSAGAILAAASSMPLAAAADVPSVAAPPAASGPHDWHHHGGPGHLLSKLGLSDEQKQQIKGIMTSAQQAQLTALEAQDAGRQAWAQGRTRWRTAGGSTRGGGSRCGVGKGIGA